MREGWASKNYCFWTVVLEKTLESPLDSRKIKPVSPTEINPGYSLKWLMVKLKLQYIGHLMEKPTHWKRPWCLERLRAGRAEGESMRCLDGIMDSMDMSSNKLWEIVREHGGLVCCSSWGRRVRRDLLTEQQHLGFYTLSQEPGYVSRLSARGSPHLSTVHCFLTHTLEECTCA